MKKGFAGLAAFGLMLVALVLAVVPVGAQSVDEKIKALEQELSSLKEQQIDLKKEAAVAAAALPSFSYRPGNGLFIEAADKGWGIRFGMESHVRMDFMEGQDQYGRTAGQLELRRWRPQFTYCINNCLWEIEMFFDKDGFGANSLLQRGAVYAHLENLNPFFPTVWFGGDVSTSIGTIRQGSSATGAQAEYDMLSRGSTFNTGSAGWGIVSVWDDRELDGIGIPGRITRAQIAYSIPGKASDNAGQILNSNYKDYTVFFGIEPLALLKNKWLSGIRFEIGKWWCHTDGRVQAQHTCNRIRLSEGENAGAQDVMEINAPFQQAGTGTRAAGRTSMTHAGLQYTVGPSRIRSIFTTLDSEKLNPNIKAYNWLIALDQYIWSPKGWLTGSPNIVGSILFGTHFERNQLWCDPGSQRNPTCLSQNDGQYHRNMVLLREWDLWYFVAPQMSFGVNFMWYDAKNLTTGPGSNQEAIFGRSGREGSGGDWVNVLLNWRYQF
jgi:hypothetical protein